jgi:indoleacetamide hydrolase
MTASEAIQHIRTGSVRAEYYASQLLQRYRESKTLNAMTWIDEGRVLERSRSVDKARS